MNHLQMPFIYSKDVSEKKQFCRLLGNATMKRNRIMFQRRQLNPEEAFKRHM